jgi:uncharacterized repeat protein (TIGR03803 family)
MPQLCAAALMLPALGAQAGVTLTTLHSFQVFTNGAHPWSALVQGSDGNFYGTTSAGGTNGGYGTVFKISTGGALTSLYSFAGTDDGEGPNGLVHGSDGNFYGTTWGGGINNLGTVFKISTNGVLTSLYSLTGSNDIGSVDGGSVSPNGLVQGSDGNFYGTTAEGGMNNLGTVFKISTSGVLTGLYSFTGGIDGSGPKAGLVQGSDGNFYGTTSAGVPPLGGGYGTVFKISTNGALTGLYSFTDRNDGAYPQAGLVQGSDGDFYGTTYAGGTYTNQYGNGYGTVFKISTNGALTTLYSFTGASDGGQPEAALVQGSDGDFYGTTEYGFEPGVGSVFRISTNGAFTSLHSFTDGSDGGQPAAELVQGSDGNFYGTTEYGGTNGGAGTVFKINTNGALTSLYSFTGDNNGSLPYAGLVQGNDGNFYGTTSHAGTVFKISTNGALTSLYSFTGGNDGGDPLAGLVQGGDGYFYGTTYGASDTPPRIDKGTVFKISTNGALTTLYSFTGLNDGGNPGAGLAQGSDGNFYGTTEYGGTNDNGTVFQISTNGALTSLYSFTGLNDGGNPRAGLVQGGDGYFYGTTHGSYGGPNYGTVFKISTNGALTILHSFTGNIRGDDGVMSSAGLVQGSDGNFYGTTAYGGRYTNQYGYGQKSYGTVFKITANGALTSLHLFNGNDGAYPFAGLVQGIDGNFYGTTYGILPYSGGPPYGTVFKMDVNGALTTLYSFTGGNDGGGPSGLVQGSDGSFYGTTTSGGQGGEGTVFRLSVVQVAPAFQAVTLTNDTLSLTWGTEAGGRYQLQYNSDLSSSNWTSLGSAITATGATLNVTDSVTNSPRRVYRLELLP